MGSFHEWRAFTMSLCPQRASWTVRIAAIRPTAQFDPKLQKDVDRDSEEEDYSPVIMFVNR